MMPKKNRYVQESPLSFRKFTFIRPEKLKAFLALSLRILAIAGQVNTTLQGVLLLIMWGCCAGTHANRGPLGNSCREDDANRRTTPG
jgi:hypothetical protein